MSFPRYPAYKDSGVEWLGEVPEHWKVYPLSTLAQVIDPQPDHRAPAIANSGEGFPYIGIRDINPDGTINTATARNIEEDAVLKQEASFAISPGDIIFCKVGTLGLPRHIKPDSRIALSATLVLIKVGQHQNNSFICYALDGNSTYAQIDLNATGSTRSALGIQQIRRFRVAAPPSKEQEAIAKFLDHETAKIDALIAEQQRLIELLQEKRQAVISHAVTKGLNPDAPMKDSGVEWLGEVPEHWRVLRGNYVGSVFGSEQIPEEKVNQEGDIPFIKVSTLSENCFEPLEPVWFVARADIRAGRGRKGFLVFPKRGAAIFGNKVNIIKVESLIDPNLMGWLISDNGAPAFYAYTLKSKKLEEIADVSTVPQINTKHIAQELWPCPALIEQYEIIAFLDDQAAMFDSLVEETNSSIALLQERRSALISAAVTGQIDVRGLVPEARTT